MMMVIHWSDVNHTTSIAWYNNIMDCKDDSLEIKKRGLAILKYIWTWLVHDCQLFSWKSWQAETASGWVTGFTQIDSNTKSSSWPLYISRIYEVSKLWICLQSYMIITIFFNLFFAFYYPWHSFTRIDYL